MKFVKQVINCYSKAKRIRAVLTAFKHMGASKEDLAIEKAKLQQNEMYLAEWIAVVKDKE